MLQESVIWNTYLVVVLFGLTMAFQWRIPRPEKAHGLLVEFPSLSVVLPVHNRSATIEATIEAFRSQGYPHLEIVIVDDNSDDGTFAIADRAASDSDDVVALRLSGPPPEGWTRRNFALARGIEYTRGQWVLVGESDVTYAEGSLTKAMKFAVSNQAHMVSFWPLMAVARFWEQALLPVYWASFFWSDPLLLINDFATDTAYATGCCLLADKRAYLSVGGLNRCRAAHLADHALTTLAKDAGLHVMVADGRKMVTTRMFASHGSIWAVFSQLLFDLTKRSWLILAIGCLCITSMTVVPFVLVIAAAFAGAGAQLWTWLAVQLAAVVLWYAAVSRHFRGLNPLFLLSLPVAGVVVTACYLFSGVTGRSSLLSVRARGGGGRAK